MIAVVDSSSIILLAKIGRVDLLRELFDQVVIPPAVREELSAGGDRPGVTELRESPWISVRSVEQPGVPEELIGNLGRGEAEVLALAQQVEGPVVLVLDDAAAVPLFNVA